VAQEQLVIYFNRNTTRENLVAIYPKEGTFYMDHPLVLLDGPWVTKEQQRAFHSFAEFVTDPEQQHMVLREGYRPGVLRVPLDGDDSLIQPDYKVDPTEPKKLLKVPPAGVVEVIRELWRLIKKPANIYLLADVSGSMQGEKLSNAKRALLSFIDQVEGERDRVALVTFSSDIKEVKILLNLKQSRKSFKASIRELKAVGGTRLYDAVWFAYERLQEQSDPARINAMVVMTDGKNTEGSVSLEDIRSKISKADAPVLIFSVAYGEDADRDILQQIARLGSGYAYPSDPETIGKLYELICKFF
jgi:Ca-activated chloride channel family protein